MKRLKLIGCGNIGLVPIVHEVQQMKKTGVEIVVVDNEKKEQQPFHEDKSFELTAHPKMDMPFVDIRNINKKFYTDISNKRTTKKKKR